MLRDGVMISSHGAKILQKSNDTQSKNLVRVRVQSALQRKDEPKGLRQVHSAK